MKFSRLTVIAITTSNASAFAPGLVQNRLSLKNVFHRNNRGMSIKMADEIVPDASSLAQEPMINPDNIFAPTTENILMKSGSETETLNVAQQEAMEAFRETPEALAVDEDNLTRKEQRLKDLADAEAFTEAKRVQLQEELAGAEAEMKRLELESQKVASQPESIDLTTGSALLASATSLIVGARAVLESTKEAREDKSRKQEIDRLVAEQDARNKTKSKAKGPFGAIVGTAGAAGAAFLVAMNSATAPVDTPTVDKYNVDTTPKTEVVTKAPKKEDLKIIAPESKIQPKPFLEPKVEVKPEPKPVVEVKKEPAPAPVVEVKKEPAPVPVVEVKPEPKPAPVVEVKKEPAPAPVVEVKKPEPAPLPVPSFPPSPAKSTVSPTPSPSFVPAPPSSSLSELVPVPGDVVFELDDNTKIAAGSAAVLAVIGAALAGSGEQKSETKEVSSTPTIVPQEPSPTPEPPSAASSYLESSPESPPSPVQTSQSTDNETTFASSYLESMPPPPTRSAGSAPSSYLDSMSQAPAAPTPSAGGGSNLNNIDSDMRRGELTREEKQKEIEMEVESLVEQMAENAAERAAERTAEDVEDDF